MATPMTITQRLRPLLEKFEVDEWQGKDVKLFLRECPRVKVSISTQHVSGPGGSHPCEKVHASFSTISGETNSLHMGVRRIARDLESALESIQEYLAWAEDSE